MTAKTLRTKLIRILILFVTSLVFLAGPGTVFVQTPPVTAKWLVPSPDNNHLGDIIKATLRITTQRGVSLDWTKMPDVGDILPLPPNTIGGTFYPHEEQSPGIPEGELEVVFRHITEHPEGSLVVTEIAYEFIYLLPLDLSGPSDDKRLPWDVPLSQEYRQFHTYSGKWQHESDKIYADMTDFSIAPRVDENSVPIFKLFEAEPPATYWPSVRLTGFASLGLAVCLLIRWGISFVVTRRHQMQTETTQNPPEANELYQIWCQNPDQAIFTEALKLYRRGIWGRPQASTWLTTTFILYSGVRLTPDQMRIIFARLVKEVADEPSS